MAQLLLCKRPTCAWRVMIRGHPDQTVVALSRRWPLRTALSAARLRLDTARTSTRPCAVRFCRPLSDCAHLSIHPHVHNWPVSSVLYNTRWDVRPQHQSPPTRPHIRGPTASQALMVLGEAHVTARKCALEDTFGPACSFMGGCVEWVCGVRVRGLVCVCVRFLLPLPLSWSHLCVRARARALVRIIRAARLSCCALCTWSCHRGLLDPIRCVARFRSWRVS